MRYHPDSDPYVSEARPGPWRRRLCAALVTITLIVFCLVAFGCALPGPKDVDSVLEGVKGDATYSYAGILGSTTAIADGYSNGPDKAKANRLYFNQTFPWGSSITLDIKDYERPKIPPPYAPPGPHVEASAEARPGVGEKARGSGGAPSSVAGPTPGAVSGLGLPGPATDSPSTK